MTDADIVCKEGVCPVFYEKVRPWLDAKEGRRLFWIGEEGAICSDPRARVFSKPQAIGAMAASRKIFVVDDAWRESIEAAHRTAELVLSESADFGVFAMRHLLANFAKPMRSLPALRGSMRGVPAIVLGAGPSLEQNGHLLSALEDRALLIAAGSAMHVTPVKPHLAVALDPHFPLTRTRYFDVPLCLQGRTHPGTRQSVQGEVLYFPDSHFAFEPWLMQSSLWNSGWTVGTAAVSIAIELGCNPIWLVGMDFCYRGTQKYAGQKNRVHAAPRIPSSNRLGHAVETQSDWLAAIRWLEETAVAHPEIDFFNAVSDGMEIGAPFRSESLRVFEGSALAVRKRWQHCMESAPQIALTSERLSAWRGSLARCRGMQELLSTEVASTLLLEPLWSLWAPLFERELMTDPHKIPMAQKLALQKGLFFDEVIREHERIL